MKNLILKLYTLFYTLRLRWRGNLYNFKRAVKKANRAKRRTYVIFLGGKYRALNRNDFHKLRVEGVIKQNINMRKIQMICLYDSFERVLRHPNPKYNKFLNR